MKERRLFIVLHYACFFLVSILITNKVPTVSTMEIANEMYTFFTKAAMIKLTKEIAATVMAYGNCVDTWLM